MLKQPCHSVGTSSTCGASFSQDHTTFLSSPKKATALFDRFMARPFNWMVTAFEVRKERRALANLTPQQLEDIGLDKEQVRQESLRAYWDLPADRVA